MKKIEKQILEVLQSIEGNGSFVSFGSTEFAMPGLHIEGYGELPLPLTSANAKQLIATAQKASFGKGSKTVKDTNVRSAWEIDASKIEFKNKAWDKKLSKIISKVKDNLGIEEREVNASLYKLLIYEQGDFFRSHKDSEKEKGMFGTLVVGLPSVHKGGELVVRFDGREESISFVEATRNYQIPYAAFYADCEHELKPVTEGYRICLTYNLVHTSKRKINSPEFSEQVIELSSLLKVWGKSPHDLPGVALLEHQYTPANISIGTLKGHDSPRAQALLLAAEKANCYATLNLVSLYQMGNLEGVGYDEGYYGSNKYNYESGDDYVDGYMGEIFEQHTRLVCPDESDNTPSLGEIDIEQDKLISAIKLEDDEPIEKEAEGYTGNAGMTMEYWYHYGAIAFWPKNKHADLLFSRPIWVKLNWLGYYLNNWDTLSNTQIKIVEKLLAATFLSNEEAANLSRIPKNFNAYAGALAKIKNQKLFENCSKTLALVFDKISLNNWLLLFDVYEQSLFSAVFELAINKGKLNISNSLSTLAHYCNLLGLLLDNESGKPTTFILYEIFNIPKHLETVNISSLNEKVNYFYENEKERQQKIKSILSNVISFSVHQENDEKWIADCLESITKNATRKYINKILVPLFSKKKEGAFYKTIQKFCLEDLQIRTAKKPDPPSNWKRVVPKTTKYDERVWEMLRAFLESPTDTTFNYSKNQAERSYVEHAIENVTIDLKMETIKTSRPYTLKITKTQTAYEKKLKKYKQDLKLLERFK